MGHRPVHKHPKMVDTAKALGISLVWLPTYTPWLNPIEKPCCKLQQELFQPPLADQRDRLKEQVGESLNASAAGSPDLLRYVGLSLEYVGSVHQQGQESRDHKASGTCWALLRLDRRCGPS